MYVHELGSSGWEKKQTKTEATAAAALLGSEVQKSKNGWMKLHLCNERYSMVGGCHGEKIKFDGEQGTWRKIFIFVFLSPLVQATYVT